MQAWRKLTCSLRNNKSGISNLLNRLLYFLSRSYPIDGLMQVWIYLIFLHFAIKLFKLNFINSVFKLEYNVIILLPQKCVFHLRLFFKNNKSKTGLECITWPCPTSNRVWPELGIYRQGEGRPDAIIFIRSV